MKFTNSLQSASAAIALSGALAACTVSEALPSGTVRVDDHHDDEDSGVDAGMSDVNVGGQADTGLNGQDAGAVTDAVTEVGGNVQDVVNGTDTNAEDTCVEISGLNAIRLRDHQSALQAPSVPITFDYSSMFGLPANYESSTFKVAELTSNTGIIQMHATDAQSSQVLGATAFYSISGEDYSDFRYTEHRDQAGTNASVRFYGFEGVVPAGTRPTVDYKIAVSREGEDCFVQEGTNSPQELCRAQCDTILANVEAVLR
jgi:hypothetical protein